MIKTPVNIAVYNGMHKGTQWLQGSDSRELSRDELNEAAKRINMHDELVKSLDEMCGVWRLVCNSSGWDENHMSQYENAIKLLEKCK